MFQTGESFLLEDALSEDAFKEQESILALRIRSAMCVPLTFHNQIYGLLYIHKNVPGAYRQDDLEFLRSIAFILAPLIENARLWTELKKHYDNAMETLRETQARLIDMERKAAYVRLAHAMAHEIRNPLLVMGGLLRRMAKSSDAFNSDTFTAVMSSVERIELVLREVDSFVKIPEPQKTLVKIDHLIKEGIEQYEGECAKRNICPHFVVNTSHLAVPLDSVLFKKAFSMIFREIMLGIPQGSPLNITVCDCDNEIEIIIGDKDEHIILSELYSPELQDKPWSLSLFLNIAHKILSDHSGKILFPVSLCLSLPVIIRISRTQSLMSGNKY
jgi:signal transduction histidine kinase